MIRILTAVTFLAFTVSAAWSADVPAPASGDASSGKPSAATTLVSTSSSAPAPTETSKKFLYAPKESDIVTGKDSAPVTIVEYASLSCPHCSHFFVNELPALTSKYLDTGKAKLVFRNYPLNDPALKGAELVECAPEGSRHAFVKVMFESQLKWAYDTNYRDALSNIAVLGGIDRLKFESCMNNKAVEKTVIGVAKEAADDYHVNSTPSFFINGTAYKGSFDSTSLSKVIDAELAKSDKK